MKATDAAQAAADGKAEPFGPYQPSWENRRIVVRCTLIWCALMLPAFVFCGPDREATPAAVYGVLSIGVLTLTYYLIGPSVELVRLAQSWGHGVTRVAEKLGAEK